MRTLILLALLASGIAGYTQFQAGIFGGVSNYTGDLLDKPFGLANGAFGITAGYALSNRFAVRAGFTAGKIEGADSISGFQDNSKRNLSFQSSISEFSIVGEYHLFNLEKISWTPFAFTGLAVYHYDPYAFDQNGQKYFLQPLGTEGQGLPQYPERKPYALTKVALPIGGGLKFALNERVQVAGQIGLRITNNDYLDDVSTTYAGQEELLEGRGPKAVELAYRSDELPGGNAAYPRKGASRGRGGGLIYTDFYYFSGLHVSFLLGGNGKSNSRTGYGCPAAPL